MSVNYVLIIPGIGPSEMMIVAFIVMLLFGAKKLPELARSLGKSKGEFEKGKHDSESKLDSESKVESKSNSVTKSRELILLVNLIQNYEMQLNKIYNFTILQMILLS